MYDNQLTKEEYAVLLSKEKNKYHARKTTVDGIVFDSRKEAERYTELKALENLGLITGLRRQVKYVLIPSQKDPETGKVLERPCCYVADFVYHNEKTGEDIVEDTKGMRTAAYKIKRKLMLEKFGIRVREI